MTSPTDLKHFARDTVQDVLSTAEATDGTAPDAFTQRMIEHLTDAGATESAFTCFHQARGIEVSGYGLHDESETVDVFVSSFRQDILLHSLTRTDLDTLLRRLGTFVRRCRDGYSNQIEDASPTFDMVQDLERALKTARRVRLFVLTNGLCKVRTATADVGPGLKYEVQVWDLERLHRMLHSGVLHEPIVIDFVDRFGAPLPCLTTPETDEGYSVLMAIVPGRVLDSLYGEFGSRLLELNVRSFLQVTGAVNRGIRDTLVKNPERFLAYNNGISATASRVEFGPTPTGGRGILRLHDLQIVNGGQTTASIHTTAKRNGADLDRVFVQAKITVVSPELISEIVPKISQFSNTQNKVTLADFSSNDAFHVAVEKLSRSVWAPSATGDKQETHWFYERARGQYADELSRRTPAQQKAWKLNNPTRQKFTKTDLAKFAQTYARRPEIVSRGAEKNFREFMVRLSQEPDLGHVDEQVFRDLIAKAILFRTTERIVGEQQFGGYRANIVTYTIARLVQATDNRLDLRAIWQAQAVTPALRSALEHLCRPVQQALVTPPNGANISEWCKNSRAWIRVQALGWEVPAALQAELLDPLESRARDVEVRERVETARTGPDISRAASVSAQTWTEVFEWAKANGHLEPHQRGMAANLANRARRKAEPNAKQAEQGLRLLRDALDAGFRPQTALPVDVLES